MELIIWAACAGWAGWLMRGRGETAIALGVILGVFLAFFGVIITALVRRWFPRRVQ